MIQSQILPENLSLEQAVDILKMDEWQVKTLVTTKAITSKSYTELPTASVGLYMADVMGMETEAIEAMMVATLYPNT